MAETFLSKLAMARVLAVSAGTKPTEAINPTVVEIMREVGIDISHKKPKRLTREMVEQASRVITMGCGVEDVCPATFVETEYWALDDPKDQPLDKVREIRKQIQAKVLKLLEEIP